ncbi:MAG: hypothetical protein ACHQ1H_02000 [Nitrososphaerales archaeon]
MKSKTSKSARSIVLTTFVILAIASAVTSALYLSGMFGTNQGQTTTSQTTPASPGGFMLARNATATFCTMSTTENSSSSSNSNGTTTTTTSDCLPIGYR